MENMIKTSPSSNIRMDNYGDMTSEEIQEFKKKNYRK